MMKQIIMGGVIFLTGVAVTHASCLTAEEVEKYQNIANKAEEIKDKLKDDPTAEEKNKDRYRHNFKLRLELVKKGLERAQKLKAGALCTAQKNDLQRDVTAMKSYITDSKSELSLD